MNAHLSKDVVVERHLLRDLISALKKQLERGKSAVQVEDAINGQDLINRAEFVLRKGTNKQTTVINPPKK